MRVAESDYRSRATAGISALQRWYRPGTGLWAGTGWWNCANALTAVIRYTKLTGDSSHAGVLETTFSASQRPHAVRYLYDFWLQSRQPAYRAFILANAHSIWNKDKNAADQFGLRWAGPFDRADAARQSSALDALIAAAALAL